MVRKIEMVVLSACLFVACVASIVSADVELESSVKDLLSRRKNLNYVKNLLQDLDSQLEKLQEANLEKSGKRLFCIPGMGCEVVTREYNVNYPGRRDSFVFGTGKDKDHHENGNTPGRRRICIPGTGCGDDEIIGKGGDGEHFEDSNNPGRRELNVVNYPGRRNSYVFGTGQEKVSKRFCMPGMGCGEEKIIGVGGDGEHFEDPNGPGRRELNVFGSGEDRNHFENGHTPGRRGICLPGMGCGDSGVIGSGGDRDHHETGNTPGRRGVGFCPAGMDCDAHRVIGTGEDRLHFDSTNSPGRRHLLKRATDQKLKSQ